MNCELRNSLEQYRECSLSIIEVLEKEDYEELNNKLDKRQEILDAINKLSFTKLEISVIVEELKIDEISEKIVNLIDYKKNQIKAVIEGNVAKKNASNQYSKNNNSDLRIFSKKV